ncbi:hypothetical protein PFTANZ_06223 [Plasmodium falciparum Tanzania (2000708)]|uniref:Plasmodium RESA N-terminal domain-containing protein n=1 Tax=Plasmodium falciparum Tanzania (2000708) TaxID=1036725 RepID=A0A024VXT1_PLAFA|nr:hypothetical protein PFTANZ_06223 [Plasmodium falciparum Tanzania (2000708)]
MIWLKILSFYIEHYLLKYEYQSYYHFCGRDKHVCAGAKYRTWYKSMHDFRVALSSRDMERTLNFYNLGKDGIFYYDTLKK